MCLTHFVITANNLSGIGLKCSCKQKKGNAAWLVLKGIAENNVYV